VRCCSEGTNDSKDRQLMLEKIAFMAALAEHANIVKFVASCNDVHAGIQAYTKACASLCLHLIT